MSSALRDETVLWLATTRPDGRPHLTPIWFRFVDDRFWLCTMAKAVKARNLRANPACSVALGPLAQPTVAEGSARLWDRAEGPFPASVVASFREGFDWDIDADPEGYDCLIEIEVRRWLYGAGPEAE